ncbi:MAG: deoxyribonuclease IV, partial [Tepidiformaceae bacterium]
SAPQQWKAPAFTDEQVAEFRTLHDASQMPAFFHGVYLVNLGSKDEALLGRSVESLTQALRWAGRLGVSGVIFHAGSHLGQGWDDDLVRQVCALMRKALEAAPGDTFLVLENNAGQGNCIGGSWAELGALIRGLDNEPRVAVCLDTCHALAMNYDVSSRPGCDDTMASFDKEIGLNRLVAVHANDSKMPLGGLRDRHENIGDGHIGLDGFAAIMAHPAFRDVPFVLEVPGLAGDGPDVENVMRLKAIRAGVGIAAPVLGDLPPEPAPKAAARRPAAKPKPGKKPAAAPRKK